MFTAHIIFKGPGIYEPRICPRTTLWELVGEGEPDPDFGVYVPSADNASTFANVTVVKGGIVVQFIEQKEWS